MNRSAAVARDIAEFFIKKDIDPLNITEKEFDALEPPYRAIRVKIYFLTWRRAMVLVSRHMERIRARPQSVARSPAARREALKKKVVNEE